MEEDKALDKALSHLFRVLEATAEAGKEARGELGEVETPPAEASPESESESEYVESYRST